MSVRTVELVDDELVCSACTQIVSGPIGAVHMLAAAEHAIRRQSFGVRSIIVGRTEHGVVLPRRLVDAIAKLRIPWVFEGNDLEFKDRLVSFALGIDDDWPSLYRALEARYGYRYPQLVITP